MQTLNYYTEQRENEDRCDKCGLDLQKLGTSIHIVHIGIYRRNLCTTCRDEVKAIIDQHITFQQLEKSDVE